MERAQWSEGLRIDVHKVERVVCSGNYTCTYSACAWGRERAEKERLPFRDLPFDESCKKVLYLWV